MILDLTPEIEGALRRRAVEGGLTLEAYVVLLVQKAATDRANGVPGEDIGPADEDERPWRGILRLPRRRQALLSEAPLLPPGPLPRRQPTAQMNWHRLRLDDE